MTLGFKRNVCHWYIVQGALIPCCVQLAGIYIVQTYNTITRILFHLLFRRKGQNNSLPEELQGNPIRSLWSRILTRNATLTSSRSHRAISWEAWIRSHRTAGHGGRPWRQLFLSQRTHQPVNTHMWWVHVNLLLWLTSDRWWSQARDMPL